MPPKQPKAPDENDLMRANPSAYDPLADVEPWEPDCDEETPGTKSATRKPSPRQAARLIELADANITAQIRWDGDVFVALSIGARQETVRIESDRFAKLLRQWMYQAEKVPPSQIAVTEAQSTLAARASLEGIERPIFRRIGKDEGALYLDLADDQGRVVEVTAEGWRILPASPVFFLRPQSMLPLPAPVRGGSLSELFTLINLPAESHALALGWLVGALRPDGPFPLLAVHGEQGSGKSTACKMLRAIIDPDAAPLRSVPREPRGLMIATRQAWVLGFDNLSTLPGWLSDDLCCIATGTTFPDRQLYTNDREVLFVAKQPILINGIEELATRADLLDRCLVLSLPTIAEDRRQPESDLWGLFYAARPRLLGALLDAVSCALRRLPEIKAKGLPRKPRMADFAVWVTAAEPSLGLNEGGFLAAYFANISASADLPLEASAIAAPLRTLLDRQPRTLDGAPPSWTGTATALLSALRDCAADDERRQRDWPRNAQGLSGQLKRLAPNLRQKGIHIEHGKAGDRKRTRTITIRSDAC